MKKENLNSRKNESLFIKLSWLELKCINPGSKTIVIIIIFLIFLLLLFKL